MSGSLVRKSLTLFEREDEITGGSAVKRNDKSACDNGAKRLKFTSKPKRNVNGKSKLKSSVEQLQMQCVLDEVRKRKNLDLTEDNLLVLQQISQTTVVEPVAVDKIISHQIGRLAKNQPPVKKKRKEEKTLFTEDDFVKFEKEYFVHV